MDRDLYKKLGLDPKTFSEEQCHASEECHEICDWLLDQIEFAQKEYVKAMKDGDEMSAYRIRIGSTALLEAAHAIHMGAHLE